MTSNSIPKNAALSLACIVLSCGPSQLYGVVKGIIDYRKYRNLQQHIAQCTQIESLYCANDVAKLKQTKAFQALHTKLSHHSPDTILALLRKRNKEEHFELTQQQQMLATSLKTDLVALTPFVGALCAWRLNAGHHAWKWPSIPCLEFSTAHVLNHSQSSLQQLLFPLSGISFRRQQYICQEGRVSIPVPSRSGEHLDALFLPGKGALPNNPAIVLFHGNEMTCHDFIFHARVFQELGFNVLAATMGGYPGSPGVATSEASTYQDVEAIKHYLKQKGITQAGYYGFSIGGSLAFQAAIGASEAGIDTLFVIADQTFSSGKRVMENVAHAHISSYSRPLARGVSHAALPKRPVRLSDHLVVHTDGLDNARKAALLNERNIPLLAIKSSHDVLMGWGPDAMNGTFTHNFADELIKARYGQDPSYAQNLLQINGGHGAYCFESKEGRERVAAFALNSL